MGQNRAAKHVPIHSHGAHSAQNRMACFRLLKRIKPLIEIIGLLALLATLGVYVWLAFLQKDANEINRQSMMAAQKSIEFTQHSIDLTQKSLGLNQQSVKTAQDAFALTAKSNEISQQSLAASNMPWIDVNIISIGYTGNHSYDADTADLPPNYGVISSIDSRGHETNASLDIHYAVENHSDSPAKHIYVTCFLKRGSSYKSGFSDREAIADDSLAVMPKQTINRTASMLSEGGDPRSMIDLIKREKAGIRIYVFYFDALKNKTSFIETFYYIGGKPTLVDTEFDPTESEIEDMIYERDASKHRN